MRNRLVGLLILLTLSPLSVFAHGFGWNEGCASYMGRFFGGGWMMILWFGVLLLVVYAIIRWTNSTKQNRIVSSDALSILAERYAKGEITTEEFNVIKKELK